VYTGLDADTAGADIASATATDLTAATGNTVVITGTTTATSLTMNVGQQMILLPSGAWPLTYHATTMNINGGVSYTCAAGDRIYAVKDLAGVIRVSVFKQDGTALVPGAASSVAVGDITGAGTGVLTALAVNVGSAGAPVVLNGALGTPSGGTATNLTGLPPAGVTGTAAILGANTFTGIQTTPNRTLPAGGQDLLTVPSVDNTATGQTTSAFVSGYSSSAIGDLVYLASDSKWKQADANTLALYNGLLGIALEVSAADASLLVALSGSFVYAATVFPTFTIGSPVYMSETAGLVTNTAPTTTDAARRIVGWGVHADKLYFSPSQNYITHT